MESATLANYTQIASFILTVILLVWPQFKGQWPQQPQIWAYIFLAIWVLTTTYLYFQKPKIAVYPGATKLALLFPGGDRIPQPQTLENIARWYALSNTTVLFDKKGNRTDIRTWTIFLVFEKDINPTYLHIVFNSPNTPAHEVKDFGSRHAVVWIAGDIPPGVVEFRVDKPLPMP